MIEVNEYITITIHGLKTYEQNAHHIKLLITNLDDNSTITKIVNIHKSLDGVYFIQSEPVSFKVLANKKYIYQAIVVSNNNIESAPVIIENEQIISRQSPDLLRVILFPYETVLSTKCDNCNVVKYEWLYVFSDSPLDSVPAKNTLPTHVSNIPEIRINSKNTVQSSSLHRAWIRFVFDDKSRSNWYPQNTEGINAPQSGIKISEADTEATKTTFSSTDGTIQVDSNATPVEVDNNKLSLDVSNTTLSIKNALDNTIDAISLSKDNVGLSNIDNSKFDTDGNMIDGTVGGLKVTTNSLSSLDNDDSGIQIDNTNSVINVKKDGNIRVSIGKSGFVDGVIDSNAYDLIDVTDASNWTAVSNVKTISAETDANKSDFIKVDPADPLLDRAIFKTPNMSGLSSNLLSDGILYRITITLEANVTTNCPIWIYDDINERLLYTSASLRGDNIYTIDMLSTNNQIRLRFEIGGYNTFTDDSFDQFISIYSIKYQKYLSKTTLNFDGLYISNSTDKFVKMGLSGVDIKNSGRIILDEANFSRLIHPQIVKPLLNYEQVAGESAVMVSIQLSDDNNNYVSNSYAMSIWTIDHTSQNDLTPYNDGITCTLDTGFKIDNNLISDAKVASMATDQSGLLKIKLSSSNDQEFALAINIQGIIYLYRGWITDDQQ